MTSAQLQPDLVAPAGAEGASCCRGGWRRGPHLGALPPPIFVQSVRALSAALHAFHAEVLAMLSARMIEVGWLLRCGIEWPPAQGKAGGHSSCPDPRGKGSRSSCLLP